MGERKILTRDLLREVVTTKAQNLNRIKLPEVGGFIARSTLHKAHPNSLSATSYLTKVSSDQQEIVYPFSLIEEIIEGKQNSEVKRSAKGNSLGPLNVTSMSWLKPDSVGVSSGMHGIQNLKKT